MARVIIEVLAQEDYLADQTTITNLAAILKQLMATPHVSLALARCRPPNVVAVIVRAFCGWESLL